MQSFIYPLFLKSWWDTHCMSNFLLCAGEWYIYNPAKFALNKLPVLEMSKVIVITSDMCIDVK